MQDLFKYADEIGPAKIIHIYEPSAGLKGILVVDNVAMGPSIGGVRIAMDVSLDECFRLARAMTFKNAAAASLRNEESYIFGPDMGTDEECMAWVKDENGRAISLPRELGGIPLDEIGATAWGVYHAADVALRYLNFDLKDAKAVIQGFGSVGKHAARFLSGQGAKLIAANDSRGTIYNPEGLDISALFALKDEGKSVADYPDGKRLGLDKIIDIECDIWIPAARPDVINEDNVHQLKTRLIVQGANIPVTNGAEKQLFEKGVMCIPDFIANAGGVICGAEEYHSAMVTTALQTIEEKVRQNTEKVLEISQRQNIPPREAAMQMATDRLKKAMSLRRWSLFSSAPHFN